MFLSVVPLGSDRKLSEEVAYAAEGLSLDFYRDTWQNNRGRMLSCGRRCWHVLA